MNARLASALLALSACTVYRVPEDSESSGGGASSSGASASGGATTSGEATTTTTSGAEGSTSSTTTTTTTGPETSAATNPVTTDPPPMDCDFPTSIQPIFDGSCDCHQTDMPPKGLSLKQGAAFDNLVGVDSMEQPGTPRVDPNSSATSWLFIKLGPMPPVPETMPKGATLDPAAIDLIKTWIDAGAPEAGAFACGGGGGAGSVTIDEPGPFQVEVGELIDLDIVALDGQGQPVPMPMVTWKSSDEAALYVDAKGTLLGIAPGTVEVTAEVADIVSDPVSVEVKANDPLAEGFKEVLAVTGTSCGCHKGDMPPAGLAFDAADIYTALLGPSTQQPMIQRVAKDAPGQSYLFQKLTRATPATGAQMPKGNAPLEAEKVQVFLRWILAGAPE